MSRYAKTIVAVIAALIVILTRAQELFQDGSLSPDDYVTIVIVALGAIGVFAIPNTRPAGEPYAPTVSEAERR